MRFYRPTWAFACFVVTGILVTSLGRSCAQQLAMDRDLPDAPVPQTSSSSAPPAPSDAPQSQQSSPSDAQQQQNKPTSDEVLQREVKQRAFGVMPLFNSVGRKDYIPPLRPGQKFHLFFRSTTDPFVFGLNAILAGIGQAENTNAGTKTVTNPDGTKSQVRWGFGQGASGYFKRFGAGYADTFDGNFWGNAVLPVLLKEDPRYYRMGTGSFAKRFFYSASTAVWSRRDNGKWGPNYANVAGNFIGGGISNFYYPDENTGFEKTVIGAFTVTAEGVIGSELVEFLPDIENHFLKKRREKKLKQLSTP